MDLDYQYFDATMPWMLALRTDVDAMGASEGKIKRSYRLPPKTRDIWWPDAPFWNTAKESATVGLMPREEAGMFDLVYTQQHLMTDAALEFNGARSRQASFENRFTDVPSL